MADRLERGTRAVGAAALLLLFALVVAQVILRYGFGITPFFTEEVARYALVWSVLAGAAVSVRTDSHIRVTFLPDRFRPRLRRGWMRLLDLVTLLLLAVLVVASLQTVDYAAGQTSSGLQLPLQIPYAALPVAFLLALLFQAGRLRRAWREGMPPA